MGILWKRNKEDVKFRLSTEEILRVYSNKSAWWYCVYYVQHKYLADGVMGVEFQSITNLITNLGILLEFSWGECQTPSLLKGSGGVFLIPHYNWNLAFIRNGTKCYSGCLTLPISSTMLGNKQSECLSRGNLNWTILFPNSYWNDGRKKIIEDVQIT